MRGSRPSPPPPPGQDAGHVCTFTCQAPSQALALPRAPPVRLLPYIMPPFTPASLPGSPFYPRSRPCSTPRRVPSHAPASAQRSHPVEVCAPASRARRSESAFGNVRSLLSLSLPARHVALRPPSPAPTQLAPLVLPSSQPRAIDVRCSPAAPPAHPLSI